MATISISQLDTATQASVDDLYEVAVVDENSQTGYASRKLTAAQIATLIAQGVQFSGLSTEAKTIIAAINEAAQNGGSEVEANPSGEATDTLNKIGIDGTIYEVGGSKPVSKTATGNPIHIEDAADAPIVSGEVTFEPQQDLHGYDKPWVGGAGKNKLPLTVAGIKANNTDGTWSGNDYAISGVTFTIQTDTDGNVTGVKANGTANNSLDFVLAVNNQLAILEGKTVVLNGSIGGDTSTYLIQATGYNGINSTASRNGDSAEFTPTSAFNYVRIMISDNVTLNNQMFYPMIRLATETDPTFEPYSNICPIEGYTDCELEVTDDATSPTVTNTYTIDLDGTRYGGKVNMVSGEMVVTKVNITFDGSNDENWSFTDSAHIAYIELSPSAKYGQTPISNLFYGVLNRAYDALLDGEFAFPQNTSYSSYINIRYDAIANLANFKTFLASNPLQVCYELAVPFTVQLTPEQIRTLEGTNNISTNMTDMSLEYITQDYQPLVELIERSAGHHYSGQERVVGTWIDGKTLYEKVVDFGALPNATTKDLNHNISDIDTVFIAGGYAKNTTSGFVQQLNVPVPSNNQTDMQSQWYFGVTSTYIRCFTLTDRTSYDECKVILQYTKTTD